MRRLGYARVSTGEQEEALGAQVARLEAAGCEEIHTDIESGREDDRDGLLEVMAQVKAGGWDELVLTRADRLGRHAAYADALIGICEAHGVVIHALDGGSIETATPHGFFMARIQTSLAEMESRMLSMRIKRQFAVYRSQGRHLRRRIPFGYMKGADHKLEPHPTNWGQALEIIENLREMGSFSRVSYDLPRWCAWTPSTSCLQAWFCNPVIRGHIGHHLDRSTGKGWKQQWAEIYYDQHQALISDGEWHELAEALKRTKNKFAGVDNSVKHSLTGLMFCANCDRRLSRNSSNGLAYWSCRYRLCKERGRVREDKMIDAAIKECVKTAERLATMAATGPEDDPRLIAKKNDLAAMRDLARRNPALESGVIALEKEIAALSKSKEPPDLAVYKQIMQQPTFFSEASVEVQRAVFHAVLSRISVGRGDWTVEPGIP